MTARKHRHHIIPKHMGGTDDEENLTPPISIQMHAEFHKQLYEEFKKTEDLIAWKALSGRITSEEARLEAAKVGQERSEKYKNRDFREHLARVRTTESCSKGGKMAAPALVEWIKANPEKHKENSRANSKAIAEKQKIPHEYKGVVYPSKKDLQTETGLSNCGFYAKLRRNEIIRLPKQTKGYD